MERNEQIAADILNTVGKDNVLQAAHCMIKKIVPDALSTLFVPFLTLLCMVPVSLIALAPLGAYLGDFVSSGLIKLGNMSGFLGVAVLSALWQFLIMSGMHLVLIYAGYDLFFAQGYDTFILPCMAKPSWLLPV